MNDINIARKYLAKAASCVDRGIGFDLSIQSYKNLMRAKKCYYTGIPMEDEDGPFKRTIDRIDATKPYEKGNVVACCHFANKMKSYVEQEKASNTEEQLLLYKQAQKVFNKVVKRIGSK